MTSPPLVSSTIAYQVGGSLPNSARTYVQRAADIALLDGLLAGEFCYVLNARQMGKSSLRVQVMQRLQAAGVACAAVDITKIGSQNINSDQWYASLIGALVQGFGLGDQFQLRAWWRERAYLGPVQRLGDFVETVLLDLITTPLVIFIDEIDSLLSLPFATDDFFTWMRACYNQRVDNPAFNRLTFALMGVTTPANLIQDKQRTPFNIGRAIPLEGLALPAAAPLAQGLADLSPNPETVLQAILDWTGGQPFLTQKLCRLAQQHLLEPIPPGQEAATICQLVQAWVLTDWEHHDEPEHLKTIRNRILANEQRAGRILGLYQHLLQAGAIPADDSSEQIELRLTGLVAYQQGQLRVFNPIYAQVFDLAWVELQLGQLRPYGILLQAWVESGCSDTSRLLRGESLKEALSWASDKSLSDQDYQFLAASQDWQQQETQRTLIIERQEKEAIVRANRILGQASQQARRLVQRSLVGLGLVSVIAIVVGTGLIRTSQELQSSQASLGLEQDSINILNQFPSQPLSSLVAAIENGRELLRLVGQEPLSQYPTTRPILTLNTILSRILARNQWNIAKPLIGSSLTQDGQVLTVLADGQVQRWTRQGEKLAQTQLSNQTLVGMRFNPEREQLAVFTQAGTGEVWSLAGRPQKLFTLGNFATGLASFKFSPTHATLAGLTNQGEVLVWAANGQVQARFSTQASRGFSLAYAPNGQTLVTTGSDGLIRVWTLSGQLVRDWQAGLGQPVIQKSVIFIDNETIASVGEDGILRLWTTQGKQINQWRVSLTPAYLVGASPSGETLLTLSEDNIIRLWTVNGLLQNELSGHERFVTSVDFNQRTKTLLSSDPSGRLFLWDFQPRDQVWSTGQASVWHVNFSPQGDHLATAGKDGSIKLWQLDGQLRQQIQASSQGINTVKFSPAGQHLAFGGDDGTVGIWPLQQHPNSVLSLQPPGPAIYAVDFSGDGHYLAAAGKTGEILVWSGPQSPAWPPQSARKFHAHTGAIWGLRFLPQPPGGENSPVPTLVSTGQDGWVRFWNVETGELIREFNPRQGWLTSLNITPDRKTVIVAGEGGIIGLWELNGRKIRQFRGHMSSILSLGLSQDGEMIVSAGQDGIVSVWALSGQPIATVNDQAGISYTLDVSPAASQHLAVAGQNDQVYLMPLYSLPDLIQQGCRWLQDYRVTHITAQTACPAPPNRH
ncbi:AAA-like domain-containing protein [Synechococcus sp. PCC 6312]|uniref:AAA-like domain-containing protein n=1 Tax=Synechococcus sp. (strain ATCC 27167 / PCC 6312) TaxID=195253 RepID=UPI00029EFF0A|nr:AAA-like domain-containing protein [Synechococcus sp. PCC 6312]AFY60724.1 WD40 repeat-containing protein [Synechococcus sp. PCC 6312]